MITAQVNRAAREETKCNERTTFRSRDFDLPGRHVGFSAVRRQEMACPNPKALE